MRRETYSSLKAVDGAWRVAMGYLYRRPIDVMTQRCGGCGREIDLGRVGDGGEVRCAACGWVGRVPGYVVGEAQRRRAEGVAGDTAGWVAWAREHPIATVRQRPLWGVLLVVLIGLWAVAMYLYAVKG